MKLLEQHTAETSLSSPLRTAIDLFSFPIHILTNLLFFSVTKYHKITLKMGTTALPISPVAHAFPHIQWDHLGSLRLTAQETALLRMAETNPIEYTLADSRDASMYARVLLKLLAKLLKQVLEPELCLRLLIQLLMRLP